MGLIGAIFQEITDTIEVAEEGMAEIFDEIF